MKLILCRHAQSQDNLKKDSAKVGSNSDLSDFGIEQSKKLADEFKNLEIDKIFCSDLKQSFQTAQIISKHLKIPMETFEDLGERRWGVLSNTTWSKVQEILSNFSLEERYEFMPEEGESWKMMEKRVLSVIYDIKKLKLNNVLIITHAGPLRAVLPILLEDELSSHQNYHLNNAKYEIIDVLSKSGKNNLNYL